MGDIEISVKSLVEYLPDKKLLYKQVFKCINKKDFKQMMPQNLHKYDVRDVRNWCLDELEIMSKKRIRAVILQQYLASSSSEDEIERHEIKDSSNDEEESSKNNKKKESDED